MSDGKNMLESFREVAQDLLVPEFKALKVSIEDVREDVKQIRADMKQSNEAIRADLKQSNGTLREEMKQSNGTLREEMKQANESLREEMKLRFENLERTVAHGDQRTEQLIRSLGDKFDTAVEIRERLAALEARLPRQ